MVVKDAFAEKPCCKGAIKLNCSKYFVNRETLMHISFSQIFDNAGRTEIGL